MRDEGWAANRKKIQRLWREEGLKVPHRKKKRQRLGTSTCPADRLRANRPNHVWGLDFQFDETSDGKILKLLNIVDERSREELGGLVERRIDADRTVDALEDIVAKRGEAPAFIRCDNGPELTANALRDWCRDNAGKRRLMILLVDGEEGKSLAARHADGQEGTQKFMTKAFELLQEEVESHFFNPWDIEERWLIPDGDRVWIACDVHEWAMKARVSRVLHDVNRGAQIRRRTPRRKRT